MPKTTLLLVTVLFGVICGNRLIDNHRLLRSSSASSSSSASYGTSYNKISDVSRNVFDTKSDEDLKLKFIEKSSKTQDLPCGNEFEFESDLRRRNCKSFRNQPNYLVYDGTNDLLHKSYANVGDFEDIFDIEQPLTSQINSKDTKTIEQPKINIFPVANYKDFYDDLVLETAKEEMTKRNGNSLATALGSPPPRGCDCKIRNDLVDLGQQHFPRYLLNAVCHSENIRNDLGPKCWSGSVCRPLEYKVKVLTFRTLMDNMQKDPTLAWLPDDLREIWKFKTVTVTAGCFCS